MKKTALVLVFLMAISAVFAGCSAGNGEAAKDTVTLALTTPIETTDPDYTQSLGTYGMLFNIYESIYSIDENTGALTPNLATEHTISDDGLVHTIKINEGMKFHNGDTVTADDCVYSLSRTWDSALSESSLQCEYAVIDDVTFTLTLTAPSAVVEWNLAYAPIMNKEQVVEAVGEEYGTDKVPDCGCGPYVLTSLDADVEVKLDVFADYHGDEPAIKHIIYKVMPDANSQLIAFESGEIDYLPIPVTSWNQIESSGKYNTKELDGHNVMFMAISPVAPGTMDIRVRQAIGYAINKENIITGALDGLGKASLYMVDPALNEGMPDDPNLFSYTYDPEKAKALLAEAGVADGIDIGAMMTIAGSTEEKAAQIIQQDLAAVGITMTLDRTDAATFFDRMLSMDFPTMITSFPNMGDFTHLQLYTLPPFFDYSGTVTFEEMYGLFLSGDLSTDAAAREAINGQVHDMYMGTGTYVPLCQANKGVAWNKDLNIPDEFVNHSANQRINTWSWN